MVPYESKLSRGSLAHDEGNLYRVWQTKLAQRGDGKEHGIFD